MPAPCGRVGSAGAGCMGVALTRAAMAVAADLSVSL